MDEMENLILRLLGRDAREGESIARRRVLYDTDHARMQETIQEAAAYLKSQRESHRDLVIFTVYAHMLADMLDDAEVEIAQETIVNDADPISYVERSAAVRVQLFYEALIMGLFAGRDFGPLDLREDEHRL